MGPLTFNGWSGPQRLAYIRKWHARRGRVWLVEICPWLAPMWRRWREWEDEQ
jgi:hypothetical protein